MRTLYGDIFTEVQGKIDEVYVYFQELLGITSGDQPIDLAITEKWISPVSCRNNHENFGSSEGRIIVRSGG